MLKESILSPNSAENAPPLLAELREFEREMESTLHSRKSPFAAIPESLLIPVLSLLHDQPVEVRGIPEKDWETLISHPQLQGIPEILYYRMSARGERFLPSESIVSRLRNQILMNRAEIFHAQKQLGELLQILNQNGIQPLVMKGLALACTAYPHLSLRRPGNDIDLLIKPEEFLRAREVLVAQGYHSESYRFEILKDLQCEETLVPPNGSRNMRPVDLHWELNVASGKRDREITRGIFARSIGVKTPDMAFQTMHPVDALAHSAVHLMRNHYRQMKLLWICDMGFLGDAISKGQGWKTVQERSSQWNVLLAVQYALKLAVAWTGLRLPEGYADFSFWPEPEQTERRAIQRAEAKEDRPDLMLRLLLKSAPGLSGKLRLLKNLVFPDISYVCGLHPPLRSWFFPGAYLSYWQWWIKKSCRSVKHRNAM
jgi:hypothetical protein